MKHLLIALTISLASSAVADQDDSVFYGTLIEFYAQGIVPQERLPELLELEPGSADLSAISHVLLVTYRTMRDEFAAFLRDGPCHALADAEDLTLILANVDAATRRRYVKAYQSAQGLLEDEQLAVIASWIERNRDKVHYRWLVDDPDPRTTLEGMCERAKRKSVPLPIYLDTEA